MTMMIVIAMPAVQDRSEGPPLCAAFLSPVEAVSMIRCVIAQCKNKDGEEEMTT